MLVAGLSLMTALAMPSPGSRWEAVLQAGLAGVPALLVVTAPKFAVDLARFGPQEPLLLGGMALGGSLLVLAARELLDAGAPGSAVEDGRVRGFSVVASGSSACTRRRRRSQRSR